jgi:hypothetical protein
VTASMSDFVVDKSEWFCEQNVVASVVIYLKRDGWIIKSIADTESRARGADILAQKDGRTLIVEVKGYPSTVYARGPKKGKDKPTKPGVQARHWYSHLLLDALLRQSEHPSAEIAIALPKFPVFTKLIARTQTALTKPGIDLFLVSETTTVQCARAVAQVQSLAVEPLEQ